MPKFLNLRFIHIIFIAIFALTSCKTIENLPGGDARENPPDPRERVKKNLEEGRGFRLDNLGNTGKGGDFMFASANELWRASLDTLDFMDLAFENDIFNFFHLKKILYFRKSEFKNKIEFKKNKKFYKKNFTPRNSNNDLKLKIISFFDKTIDLIKSFSKLSKTPLMNIALFGVAYSFEISKYSLIVALTGIEGKYNSSEIAIFKIIKLSCFNS